MEKREQGLIGQSSKKRKFKYRTAAKFEIRDEIEGENEGGQEAAGMKMKGKKKDNVEQKRFKQDQSSGSGASERNVPTPEAEQDLLQQFQSLKGNKLVCFAQKKGLSHLDDCFPIIIEKNLTGADFIGSKQKVSEKLVRVDFPNHRIQVVFKWLQQIFPVEVQVQVGGSSYTVTLGPGNTITDLIQRLKEVYPDLAPSLVGVKIKDVQNHGAVVDPELTYHFETDASTSKAAPVQIRQDPIVYLDSIFQDDLKAPPKDKPFIELGYGKKFPYQGREELKDAFREALVRHFRLKEKIRDSVSLSSISAAPGTGKTRATAEFPAIWKELVQEEATLEQFKDYTFVHLHTTYNSGSPFDPSFDEELGAEASLALRFYFSYFINGKTPMTYNKFKLRLKGDATLKRLGLSYVLDRIQREIGRKCWFFLSVDDVQKIFPESTFIQTSEKKPQAGSGSFPGLLLSTLATLTHDENRNESYTAFPLVVGTLFGPIQRYMSGSSQRTTELRVPLLNEDTRSLIVESVLGRYRAEGYEWRNDKKLERLLKVYGNFGRGLETILSKYTELHDEGQAFKDISALSVADCFKTMSKNQELRMNPEEAKKLIRIWLLGEGVERTGRIPGTEVSADVLESMGFIQLQDIVENDRTMSKMRLLASGLTFLRNSLKDSFPIFSCVVDSFLSLTVKQDQFEKTIPDFLALRAALFQPTTLQGLFPGATFSPQALANLRFKFPVTEVKKEDRTFEVSAMTVNKGSHAFDDLKGIARGNVGQIYCTGNGNQGFDFFFLLHTQARNTQARKKQAFFINCKMIAGNATARSREAFVNTKIVLNKESEPWKDGIVGVITTGSATLETALQPAKPRDATQTIQAHDVPENTFMIEAKGITTFLGPFLEYI